MNHRLLLSIGLATAMLGGSLAVIATGSGAVAAADDGTAPRFAAKADAALAKRKGASAVRYAEQAVALAPQNAAYRALLGRAYLNAGRFASAVQAFGDVLAIDPGDGRSALNLALAQTATGEWVAARGTLIAHADRIAPGDRGLALALAGDPAGGVALLAQAARDPAATATVRQNLALAFALNGRWVEARAVASVDMAPALVDRRLEEWATFAHPTHAAQQVASLLGVTPAEDRGQPVQLALVAPVAPETVAIAATSPVVPETPVAAPVAVATPRPTISFAPRREIVQPLPPQQDRTAHAPVQSAVIRRTSSEGRYFVQLGAYPNVAVARSAWHRVSRAVPQLAAFTPQGTRTTIGGAAYYRLSVGGLARADATGLCGRLRAHGGRCFVRTHAGEQPAVWTHPDRLAAR